MKIDICFPLTGQAIIPADHGYALYSAISRVFPSIHTGNHLALHSISGRQTGFRELIVNEKSRVAIRCPMAHAANVMSLCGKDIYVGSTRLSVGPPTLRHLVASVALRSRLVTIKGYFEATAFHGAVSRQLTAITTSTEPTVSLGKRRTVRIKSREIVGYEVLIEGLTAEESIAIQEEGIGGRRHMGCGVFVPFEPSHRSFEEVAES